jgi:transcriptional regulator with XRE-family HTH domain
LEIVSSKKENINDRVATRVREMRSEQDMSLDALAERSGVSRSMISLVERAETSATAVVLDRIAAALGCTLTDFFELNDVPSNPLSRRVEQAKWRDPESGYVRRMLSPTHFDSPIDLIEVTFPAGARVSYVTNQDREINQQIWLLSGVMRISTESGEFDLAVGDCLAMTVGSRATYFNPGKQTARYIVASNQGAVRHSKRK